MRERPYHALFSAAEGSETERRLVFVNTVRMLSQRIRIFLALPFKSLDRLALENRLAAIIGRGNTD
jgi:arsenate reductase (thioredoxin)